MWGTKAKWGRCAIFHPTAGPKTRRRYGAWSYPLLQPSCSQIEPTKTGLRLVFSLFFVLFYLVRKGGHREAGEIFWGVHVPLPDHFPASCHRHCAAKVRTAQTWRSKRALCAWFSHSPDLNAALDLKKKQLALWGKWSFCPTNLQKANTFGAGDNSYQANEFKPMALVLLNMYMDLNS